jgi:hypothetical protein
MKIIGDVTAIKICATNIVKNTIIEIIDNQIPFSFLFFILKIEIIDKINPIKNITIVIRVTRFIISIESIETKLKPNLYIIINKGKDKTKTIETTANLLYFLLFSIQ